MSYKLLKQQITSLKNSLPTSAAKQIKYGIVSPLGHGVAKHYNPNAINFLL